MSWGMAVEFNGTKNIVLAGEELQEYPIGGMICEYARLKPTELKQMIIENPFYSEEDVFEKSPDALMWFYEKTRSVYGVVISNIVVIEMTNILTDYFKADESQIAVFLKECNENNNAIKEYILKDSGFDAFGVSTVGQLMLTAYYSFASSYAVFMKLFDALISADMEVAAELFTKSFCNPEFQHIGFKIVYYDRGIHSIYTIESAFSLMLFEVAHILDYGAKIIKCENCGHYFVPVGRADSKYCGYPSPQDPTKTCRAIGAQVKRKEKMKQDVVTQEYRRLYMRLKMRQRRHPDDKHTEQTLKDLTVQMKAILAEREAGKKSSDDILEWLHNIDEKL